MQCAVEAARGGAAVTLIEKEGDTGGKLRNWHKLFPTFTPADEVLSALRHRLAREENITVKTDCEVTAVTPRKVATASGEELACDAVVLATGFALFDARVKEEYGYGIYDNVITSADLERMFNDGAVKLKSGGAPRRIAILHCVGSRDEKVCQRHCSKVCCVTGVKQAIELKKLFPSADVFNFYMDIRMFGPGYEEMYREAQEKYNIHFVRGRISEVSPTIDERLQIKAEDTLTGRPGAAHRHEGRRDERFVGGGERVAPPAERIHAAARFVPRQCRERRGGNILCRSGDRAQERGRIAQRGHGGGARRAGVARRNA